MYKKWNSAHTENIISCHASNHIIPQSQSHETSINTDGQKISYKEKKRDCLCELVKDYMGGLDITYTCILYKIRS